MPHNDVYSNQGLLFSEVDYYRLYIGAPAVIGTNSGSGGSSIARYLRQPALETTEEFEKRALWTPFFNYCRKGIDIYQSYMYKNKPKIENSDIDLEVLARQASLHAFIGGESYILTTDKPRVYNRLNTHRVGFQDETEALLGLYNFANITFSASEEIYIIHKGSPTEVIVNVTKGTISQGGQEQTLQDGQFVKCRWSDIDIPLSLIADVAPINVEIYNFTSILDTHTVRSLLYWIAGPSLGQEKTPLPYEYIPVDGPDKGVQITTPSMEAVKELAEQIKMRKMEIGVMLGLAEEFGADTVAAESGFHAEVKLLDTNAVISSAAFNVSRCVNMAADYHTIANGQEGGQITLDPYLKAGASQETLNKIFQVLPWLQHDEFLKVAQKVMAETAFDVGEDKLSELRDIIDRDGGFNMTDAPGTGPDGMDLSFPDIENDPVEVKVEQVDESEE